jgi:very-short-patch-repair endonuclease
MARSTSLERSVADVARILDPERGAIIGDHALRLGASLDGIRAAAERSGAARGARRVENLIGLLDDRSESPGETRTRFALAAAGLPTPVLQHRIETSEGQYRADFAWPELLVVLEFDGDAKYFDYRPTQEVLLAERRRELALVAEGWTVARVRWADLSVPRQVASTVLSAFERARRLAAQWIRPDAWSATRLTGRAPHNRPAPAPVVKARAWCEGKRLLFGRARSPGPEQFPSRVRIHRPLAPRPGARPAGDGP